ncbi:d5eea579-cbf5-497e-a8aa-5fd9b366d435 [Thermothielavioides terrestris]|uniref:D5eea579-cbf5-497e-a8aa-5fd9b366d435 n=1 Tax=Thermothielavioides terrestris TaxID=2587410 RepID=A0A446B9Z3_9PEZI|nr:d5eea579-cbf5-497e-a8aa-5fd9b366d435 [Thermothielavioides terrestris]
MAPESVRSDRRAAEFMNFSLQPSVLQ